MISHSLNKLNVWLANYTSPFYFYLHSGNMPEYFVEKTDIKIRVTV